MNKAHFLLATLLLTAASTAISQSKKAGGADLLLAETTVGESVGFQYQSRIDGRLAPIFKTANEPGGLMNWNAFVVVPSIEKTGEKAVDSLPGSTEATLRLRFSVKNAVTNRVISTRDVMLRGTGRQKEESLARALAAIRPTNFELRLAADRIRQDIRDHFLVKSDSVMLDVQKLLAGKQFGEAFVLANSVPADAPKAAEFAKLKETAFNGYEEGLCQSLNSRVETALASETPSRAMQVLATAAPAGPCAADMKPRLAAIQSRLPEDAAAAYGWFFKNFSGENGAASSREMTEAAITAEVLTGEGARLRYVK